MKVKKCPLSEEQIRALLRQYQTSRKRSVLCPVVHHFRDTAVSLVLSRVRRDHLYYDDLIQEALLSIYTAAERYDFSSSASFMTFALYYMKLAVSDFIRIYSQPISKPKKRDEDISVVAIDDVFSCGGVDALDESSYADHLLEMLDDDESRLVRERLYDVLETLSPLEQSVVRAKYGLCGAGAMLDKQIAEQLHTTPERVRHAGYTALAKLKTRMQKPNL